MEPHERRQARFDPSLDEVVAARHFASRVVAEAGLTHAVHDVALAAGELAANAAEHAHTPFDVERRHRRAASASRWPTAATALPAWSSRTSTNSERGRGMALVELVSCRWGVDRTDTGKRVWAEISY